MRRLLKVVVIGAGLFGTKRLKACLSLPKDFRVVGVVDSSTGQREKIAQQFEIPVFGQLADFSGEADLAIISVPNAYHAAICVEALKRGMHVLCEKPLATTYADAKRIAATAKRYKKIFKTGSNHRFFHTVQKAQEIYKAGKIGKLLLFKGSIGTNGSQVKGKWFWDPKIAGGGSFIDNGCHVLDIARMFMGDFVSCSAHTANLFWAKTPVEDIGSAIFITKDNRQAVITSSWFQWAGYLHIELWGKKGYIIVDSTTHDTVTVGGKTGIFTVHDYSNEPRDSYHRELLYLKDCIAKRRQPEPNASDGAAVIAMVEGAYSASRKRTWIKIPA